MAYPVTNSLLTNKAYGNYGGRPRGSTRRVKPSLLMCIHITSNASNLGPNAATNERNYANRAGSTGPSAHDYINRDGSVVHAIDTTYAAWSNGKVTKYNDNPLAQPLVQKVKAGVAAGYNPNELYVREVECVGHGSGARVTSAQKLTIAEMIARDSKATGIPISRATVGLHRDVDLVNRANCPFDINREPQLAAIISAAQAIRRLI